mmetsp:Transcript_26034/g.34836  ORF Transcript_26034/g.34836 Transcript_26034/m.34836 type:complete len:105 (+) Transcript_26034:569-883(+)
MPLTMIYSYLLINSFYFAYLTNAQANTEPVMNYLEYLNELSLIGLLYAMLFFVKTNRLDSLIVWDAGIGAITVLSVCFFINLSYLVISSTRKSIQMGKLQVIRR